MYFTTNPDPGWNEETVVISSNPGEKIRMHCGKAGKTIDLRESSPGKVECSMCGEIVPDNFVSMIDHSEKHLGRTICRLTRWERFRDWLNRKLGREAV